MVGGGILAAVLVVVAVMALGGGDHADTSQLRADLAARFSAESDISYAQAACKADIYLSDLGAGAFTNIDVSDPGSELPANLTDKVTAADTRATDECNISAAELSGTTSTTDGSAATSTTPTTGFSIGTPGSIPPNVEQLLADVYQQTFHLPQKKAQCLAHALAGALQDGSVTQAELTSGALQFLADCDITLEEIGAN